MATLSGAKRLVVKIGSALLVDQRTGKLRQDWLKTLAADVAELKGRARMLCLSLLVQSHWGGGSWGFPFHPYRLSKVRRPPPLGKSNWPAL